VTVVDVVVQRTLHSLSSNGVVYMGDWIVV